MVCEGCVGGGAGGGGRGRGPEYLISTRAAIKKKGTETHAEEVETPDAEGVLEVAATTLDGSVTPCEHTEMRISEGRQQRVARDARYSRTPSALQTTLSGHRSHCIQTECTGRRSL